MLEVYNVCGLVCGLLCDVVCDVLCDVVWVVLFGCVLFVRVVC